jgi:hypothetical protein
MIGLRALFAVAVAVSLWPCAALATACQPMDHSTSGVETGTADLLVGRCDKPNECRLFTLSGGKIGTMGDYVLPNTSSEGLVAAQQRPTGLAGYMTPSGDWKIPAKYKQVLPFCEGLAAVERVDGRWLYIDHDGNQVGDTYDNAEAFTDGRGLVTIYKGAFLHGFVDVHGKVVIPLTLEGAERFSEGLASVRVKGKWGYIDHEGKLVIAPRFGDAGFFHSGRAVVRMGEADSNGVIDTAGTFVIPPRFGSISKMADAELWVTHRLGPAWPGYGEPPELLQVFDRAGHLVTPQSYNSIDPPTEGVMAVCRHDKCGFIDVHGKVVVPLRFKGAEYFQEGLAAVSLDGSHYGFIDHTGKFVLDAKYDSVGLRNEQSPVGPFVNGLAPAGCSGHWGFIDKHGTWAIPPVYRLTEAFENGLANVWLKAGTGHVRPDGSGFDFNATEVDDVKLPDRPCGASLALRGK